MWQIARDLKEKAQVSSSAKGILPLIREGGGWAFLITAFVSCNRKTRILCRLCLPASSCISKALDVPLCAADPLINLVDCKAKEIQCD